MATPTEWSARGTWRAKLTPATVTPEVLWLARSTVKFAIYLFFFWESRTKGSKEKDKYETRRVNSVMETDATLAVMFKRYMSVFFLCLSSVLCNDNSVYRRVHTAGPCFVGEELRQGSAARDLHARQTLPWLDQDGDGGSIRYREKVEGRRDSNQKRKHWCMKLEKDCIWTRFDLKRIFVT